MTPREQLADVLQPSRAEAGYGSQGALAKRVNVSRPVISKAENPAQPCPSDAILAAWAGATGCPLDRLTELAEQARSGVPDWLVPWRAAETSQAQQMFDRLLGEAMPRTDSVSLIRSAEGQWKSQT